LSQIKVRFAPSPTGPLHIGGARSALFNYLFAQHYGGELLLRIEDTDTDRSYRKYEEEIIASLQWLGLQWGEGVGAGGENGPYRQSERLLIYEKYTQMLLDQGDAYFCFCSEEKLEEERQALMARGETPRYLGNCRHLSEEEQSACLAQGAKPVVRFRVPSHQIFVVDDLVRGRVSFPSDGMGDFIIVKSDGLPTYNFAVVVDDVLMGITHVMRAEEHLSNTPRQLMIYDALRFKRPEFAHISLILGSDRQKMSKRHGATSLMQYREMGYLPEALFNFLSLLGWSPEGEEQILNAAQIAEAFTLERVAKSPAVFDVEKLNWMNGIYIRQLDVEDLAARVKPYLLSSPYAEQIEALTAEHYLLLVSMLQDRLVCLGDIVPEAAVVFEAANYSSEALQVLHGDSTALVLEAFRDSLPEFLEPGGIKQQLKSIAKQHKLKPKDVFMPLRCALSGQTHGPELPALITIWGKEQTLERIQNSLKILTGK
jgi:nondiscriminating glutamyl-tRNA synthetase